MKLAVAIIHGIGNQPDGLDHEGQHAFAQGLIQGLRRQLGDDARHVAFECDPIDSHAAALHRHAQAMPTVGNFVASEPQRRPFGDRVDHIA